MEDKSNVNIIVSVIIVLVVVGILVFISINNKTNMNSDENTNSISAASEDKVAKVGDRVSVNYTGRLENGTVFDSSVDPNFHHVEPLIFTLGAGQVIAGWDKGVAGMKVGEKKTLTIPPEDAYKETGVPGLIPPNSTLIFDVELVAINP